MSSAATICVACGTAFDGDDGDGNAPTPAGKRHYDHGPQLVPMGVERGVWACRETRVVVRTPVTRGQPARGPQDSDKPHHNNRERVLRRERSGGNPDESHRRAICQIAGLDDMVESFPPAQAIRALSLHDHRFRIAVPSDVDAERRLAVAGEDRTPATPSTPTGRARRRWRSASSSGPDRGRLVIRSPVMLSPAWVAMSTSAPSTSASEVDAPCSGSLPPRACSKASTAASLSRSITSKLRPVRSPMLARGLAITMPCQTRKDWRTSAGSFVRGPAVMKYVTVRRIGVLVTV